MAKPIFLLLLAVLLAGCAPAAATASTSAAPPAATPALPAIAPTATPPAAQSAAPPTPTVTPSPTPSFTPSPTFTPTPTLFPLEIAALRQRAFPGSPIQIEQTLEPGDGYNRFIASYLSEGLKIEALLTVPSGRPPASGWPVIVFNHGYIPPQSYTPTGNYVAHVDILSRAGYIVFKPDYRGHGNSEGAAQGGYATPDYTVDDLNAVASIKRFPQADPNRIGMFGHSMGGHITLGVMVVSQDIKAGVIWAGVVASYADLLTEWYATPPATISDGATRWRQAFVDQFGSPQQNPDFWAAISPISFVQDISGPLQLHHGTADRDVPYQFSVDLDNALQAAGKTVEFYSYPDADHNLYNSDFTQAIYRTIAFFDRYLK